jgi:cytochrome P450
VRVSSTVPRFIGAADLRSNPLSFLRAAKAAADGLVVISEDGPIFSRSKDCSAAVAVFGRDGVQQVLTRPERFGTVVSVGELFSLPPTLIRLNSGLFSMQGEQHRSHQQMLRAMMNAESMADAADAIGPAWQSFVAGLPAGQDAALLSEMRRLVLHVSQRIVFGDDELALGKLIQSYFELRRTLSSRNTRPAITDRQELVRLGGRLDRMLRRRLQEMRAEATSAAAPQSLLGRLAMLAQAQTPALTDDQLIAHANMLFMSSSEPIAVALTWTLLLLAQRPSVRVALRQELANACVDRAHADGGAGACPLLDAVIQESLRLLPPNAIMVRLTTGPGPLLGHELPANCEVVLSPYLEHRDPREFPDPDAFDPSRWRTSIPSPYAYFPFGIGARFCIGKHLARIILVSVLRRMLSRYEVVLARDQDLDWKINITMMPAEEPIVRFLDWSPQRAPHAGGRLGGPMARLMSA